MNIWLSVFIGGGLGASLRYGISILTVSRFESNLGIATLVSNIIAALVMGFTLFLIEEKIQTSGWIRSLVLIGFCGGLSTFSTFSYETVLFLKAGNFGLAIGNVIVSTVLCLAILYPFVRIAE